MATPAELHKHTGISSRFGVFVAERHPLAIQEALDAFESVADRGSTLDPPTLYALPAPLRRQLARRPEPRLAANGLGETTPGVAADVRLAQARDELAAACDGFLRREAIRASLTPDERRELLRGMVLTRATDNRLKTFFNSGEVRYGQTPFQGKGFRSLGQEAIYAAVIRLRRGAAYRAANGAWTGDIVAPLI